MPAPNLGGTTVGYLSQAAYPNQSMPSGSGWNLVTIASANGQSFSVYANPTLKVVDFSFQGTTSVSQFYNDIQNGASAAWGQIAPTAMSTYTSVMSNPTYAGYTPFCTGHSEGAELCAAFAVEENISGAGVNGMPVANATINNWFGQTNWNNLYATWKANNTFTMYNTEGDPATAYFTTFNVGQYINTSTVTYATQYAGCEEAGIETALTGGVLGLFGVVTASYCAYKAHAVATEISASQGGTTGDTAALESALGADKGSLINDLNAGNRAGTLDSPTTTDSNGTVTEQLTTITVTATTANNDTYALSGSSLSATTVDAVTGGGVNVGMNGGVIEVVPGVSATVSGASDVITAEGSSNISVSGGSDVTDEMGTSVSVNATGSRDMTDVYGASDITYLYGTYDDSYMYGNYDSTSMYGAGDASYSYGYYDSSYTY